MNRRVWTGVVAGLLAAAVLLTVGVGAYRAGQDDEVTQVVTERSEGGEVVRVVRDGDWGNHWGPGPGFFLFPLLIIGLVVLFARGGRRHWHGYGHGYGHDYGRGYGPPWNRPCGPGPYGPGPDPEAPTAPSPTPPDEPSSA
ncbi:MAG TPA: hypothetical protein VK611_22105 [Acidimicrobiales bacterium]|nr:hypothetical protein [Acidimicrobiales bacterium]